jgi:hypothetical protein
MLRLTPSIHLSLGLSLLRVLSGSNSKIFSGSLFPGILFTGIFTTLDLRSKLMRQIAKEDVITSMEVKT